MEQPEVSRGFAWDINWYNHFRKVLAVSYKVRHTPTLYIYPTEINTYIPKKWTRIFRATLLIVTEAHNSPLSITETVERHNVTEDVM